MTMITPAFKQLFGRRAVLRFRRETWDALISELARRAGGIRESGAFLLAPAGRETPIVTSVVYYDDLDPDALNGGVALYAPAFGRLWSICAERRLRVVGDVHTHPGEYTRQSGVDRDNPMVARVGHIALIVPNLGAGAIAPVDVGVHRYLGDAGWRSSFGRDASAQIYVGRWA
jgi:proteasome lid subunit RPN8/RPN11